jgi:uncharacterized protein (TIGR02246 family)
MIVEDLYRRGIECWNARNADALAELFILDGEVVGADGASYTGRGAIHEQLVKVFAGQPPAYTAKIVGITTVTTDVAIVRAIAGMIPPGKTELDPALHVVQRMTAVFRGGDWRIALLQTTPAAYRDPAELGKHTAALLA